MSVMVKGLRMPKVCTDCPYLRKEWPIGRCCAKSEKGVKLRLSNAGAKNYYEYRHESCPLVEVKDEEGN